MEPDHPPDRQPRNINLSRNSDHRSYIALLSTSRKGFYTLHTFDNMRSGSAAGSPGRQTDSQRKLERVHDIGRRNVTSPANLRDFPPKSYARQNTLFHTIQLNDKLSPPVQSSVEFAACSTLSSFCILHHTTCVMQARGLLTKVPS